MSTEASVGLAADSRPHNSEDLESDEDPGDFQSVRCLNVTTRQINQHLSDKINGGMDRLSDRHGWLDLETDTVMTTAAFCILSTHHTRENTVTNMTRCPPSISALPSSSIERLSPRTTYS